VDGATPCIAFEGMRRIAVGKLAQVALAVKAVVERGERAPVLIFHALTSEPIEVDLRGTVAEVRGRLATSAAVNERASSESSAPVGPRGRGRPRLGVVAREVTLLPRHWEWLAAQPGGASVALRKLVEEARRAGGPEEGARRARESAYRFMSALAGNEPGFEEATRALFAGDARRFEAIVGAWPADVAGHALELAGPSFGGA